jgi:hypothetical protein
MKFVQSDGVWKVNAVWLGQGGEALKKVFLATKKAMDAQMGNIGKDGYSAEKILAELEKARTEAMQGAVSEKIRQGVQNLPGGGN